MRGYVVNLEASVTGQKEMQFFDVVVESSEVISTNEAATRAIGWLHKNYNKVKRANAYHVEEALPIVE